MLRFTALHELKVEHCTRLLLWEANSRIFHAVRQRVPLAKNNLFFPPAPKLFPPGSRLIMLGVCVQCIAGVAEIYDVTALSLPLLPQGLHT